MIWFQLIGETEHEVLSKRSTIIVYKLHNKQVESVPQNLNFPSK